MHCKFRFPLIVFILLLSFASGFRASAQEEDLQNPYKSALPGIGADKIAVYIEDLRSGEVLLDVNGEEPMVPASVTKVVTAATLVHKKGMDDRYLSKVIAAGKIDKDGVLNGNIIVKACGDPTIESAYFSEYKGIADSITCAAKRMGIKKIKGGVIIDCPRWLCEPIPSGWSKEDVNYPYGADHHAANFADNRFVLTYKSDGNYSVSPKTPDVGFKAVSGKSGVSRNPGDTNYTVGHRGRKPLSATLANPLPESSLRYAIESKLTDAGIEIGDEKIESPKHNVEIYCHKSPIAADILKSLILRSDNVMAEAMLRFAWPGTSRSAAAKNELNLWKDLGVNMNDVTLEDGSGLSRKNRLTAYALADLLVWMREKEPEFGRFLNMFPRAGQTGTLRSFLKGTQLEGRLWAKTGSMSGVQSYAGYVVGDDGKPTHVVVVMVNGFKCDRSKLKAGISRMLLDTLFPAPTENSEEMFD